MHEHGFVETDTVPPVNSLDYILKVVSGRGAPIDTGKRARLFADMSGPDFQAATLSGAWVMRKAKAGGHSFVFLRDRVAVTGRGGVTKILPVQLSPNVPYLWDGRFFCEAKTENIHVEPAQGHLQSLRQLPEFKSLFDLPSEVRGTLPLFFHKDVPIGFGAFDNENASSQSCSASRLHGLLSEIDSVSI